MAKNGVSASVRGIRMENWDNWFENTGALVDDTAKYETALWKYMQYQYPNTSDGQYDLAQDYAGRHEAAFYENDKSLPGAQVWKSLLFGLKWTSWMGAAVVAVLYLIKHHAEFVVQPFVIALVIGLVCGVGIGFLIKLLVTVSSISSLKSQMKSLEKILLPGMQYIPPKYRNSIALDHIHEEYLNYPGILTFNQAIQDLDNWLGSIPLNNNLSIGRTIAIMFDVPYQHTGLVGDADDKADAAARGLYVTDNDAQVYSSPDLPEDIKNKTFAGSEDPEDKLNQLIGLANVKDQIQKMKNRMAFYQSEGGRQEKIAGNHMAFLGSPGTGKTTVARIVTGILYDFGYIRENKCVEVDGGYMKSPYQGQTSKRVEAIINYSKGGVLFIDEAYLMLDDGSVGSEATGALLKGMEDNKDDIVVIFAGYENDVNKLIASNEGFSSRIKYKLYFNNYDLDELMQIFDLYMKIYSKNGEYHIDDDARDMLCKSFDQERTSPTFGNARTVKNALDMILDVHADHFMRGLIPADKKFMFTAKDLEVYVTERKEQLKEDQRNYIAAHNLDSQIISFQELKGRTKEGSADPDKDLNALTGLDMVKSEIKEWQALFDFYDGSLENNGNHMVFVGPPGTGKTTVAAIITGYLYKFGIIRDNSYLDINGDFLKGAYLGHTGKRTQAVIQYCQGRVLFIDEAYLLATSDNGSNNSFGQEAIGVLLDAMEKQRKDFVVIFAGYEKEMTAFLNVNTGLASRISKTFHFKSYTPHELATMMNHLAFADGFKVEKNVWVPLQQYLKTKVNEPNFGNGRFIRMFWDDVKKEHIVNYESGRYGRDESNKFRIMVDDVTPVFGKR